MRKKFNAQLILMAIIAILATFIFTSYIFYGFFKEEVQSDLRTTAHVYAAMSGKNNEMPDLDLSVEDLRITRIDANGDVLFDSTVDISTMDNHLDRPEVKEAFEKGEAELIRKSSTVDENTFYYAFLMEDGTVVRVSRETGSIWSVFGSASGWILAVIFVMIICSVLISRYLTGKLVKPIEEMTADMDAYNKQTVYKELVPFMTTIRAQHEDILKASKMRQDFTANVSHELKTPLTAISGYAELMESGMVDEEQVQHFSRQIRQNSGRLLTLINDIIKLSELDSAEEMVALETVELSALTKRCVDDLQVNAQKHDVKLMYEGTVCKVCANVDMMEELIINLCDNAIRYNEKNGSVWVSVEKLGEKIVLSVKDNGIGISKEHQERIFERFYRVDKSRSKETGGTGLGLAIVKHIVALHDAKIEVESEVGKGSKISVIFPSVI